MLFLAGIAEDADELVAVTIGIAVDITVAGGHLAEFVGPTGPGHPTLDQLERGSLGLGGLAGGAKTRDSGEQRERGGIVLARRICDKALTHDFLDVGAVPTLVAVAPNQALTPPGAENLAHHEFRIKRAAYGEQLARGSQHLGEQFVRGWIDGPCRGS